MWMTSGHGENLFELAPVVSLSVDAEISSLFLGGSFSFRDGCVAIALSAIGATSFTLVDIQR